MGVERLKRAALFVAVLAAAAACSSGGNGTGSAEADHRPLIVTTVSPITNLAANVVCDRARVVGLVPEGVNSHTFSPAPSDAARLNEADVVFVNGLNLEVPVVELARSNLAEGAEIVALAEATIEPDDYIFDFSFPESGGDPNPHLWTNPPYALEYARIIGETMAALDPAAADAYRQSVVEIEKRFAQLDVAVRRATETVPRELRRLLTYHDSFPYFARDYGWEVIGAIQPSDFSEPSAREVADLIDQIRSEDVPAIFGSEVFESRVLEQIAAETGARYVDALRDDDLPGEPGDRDHSYFGLIVFDITTIVTSLGGDATALAAVPTANICDSATYAG